MNKEMFQHINKAGPDLQDATFDYVSNFMFHELYQTLMITKNSSASGRARGVKKT